MKVLGVDPGSRRTGFGLVERQGNRYRCLAAGSIAPPARLPLAEKLALIAGRVAALVAEHQPDCVVVEEVFLHQSVRSTLVLGHVRGAVLVAAAQAGAPVAEYAAREIKMSVAGQGGADKTQVEFMVRRILGLRGELPADEADALAAALCHLHRSHPSPAAQAVRRAAAQLADLLPGATRGPA
jgi:crossover junction endodeoxyribonuclease RuvC